MAIQISGFCAFLQQKTVSEWLVAVIKTWHSGKKVQSVTQQQQSVIKGVTDVLETRSRWIFGLMYLIWTEMIFLFESRN